MSKEEKISFKNGQLKVPDKPIIPFIEGDGIGEDIWKVAKKVFDHAVSKAFNGKRKIHWMELDAGEKSFLKNKEYLPEKTLKSMKEYLVSIKGPLTTPIGKGFRSLNVSIRQKNDLYVCQRPVTYYENTPSPVKNPEKVDMVIFRENTEDIYAGVEFKKGSKEVSLISDFMKKSFPEEFQKIRFPETSGIGIKPVSEKGSKRLIRSAIHYALKEKRKSVSLVHKGNIMKFTEGAFCEWGYDLAKEEFSDQTFSWRDWEKIKKEKGENEANKVMDQALKQAKLLIKDVIADNALQQFLIRPEDFDVIATLNLNGDYLSDALAAQVGGIGIAPGGNINYETGVAVFEATHGTAPRYAGLDKVNPSSLILSGKMMFEYMGWNEAADLIEKSLQKAILNAHVTYDFHRLMKEKTKAKLLKCSEFGDYLISLI